MKSDPGMHRRRSISEICSGPTAVISKWKRLSELQRGSILYLGDLLDDQGRADAAIECLRKALVTQMQMFNLALLLQRKNQYALATDYWRRYLANDSHSDSATRARRSLKFCERHLSAPLLEGSLVHAGNATARVQPCSITWRLPRRQSVGSTLSLPPTWQAGHWDKPAVLKSEVGRRWHLLCFG
jgi:tetratricopeptide (TPR) repeat protein